MDELGSKARYGTTKEAAGFGEVILLAVNPWTEIERVLHTIGESSLAGKPLIDVSNNMIFGATPKLAFTHVSMGEFVQGLMPRSHVVKTLNIVPAAMMVHPHAHGIDPAIMWMAGDNAGAKKTVTNLVKDLGWTDVTDLGGIRTARLQEAVSLMASIVVTRMTS